MRGVLQMWSAVFGLHLQFMRFIATCTEWDPDERQELKGFYEVMEKASEYWMKCPKSEQDVGDPSVRQPDGFYETVKEAFEVYRAAAEGPTSSVVWPRSLLEDLDDLFVEIYDGYKLPLGERGEEESIARWERYAEQSDRLVKEEWARKGEELLTSNADGENLVALDSAERKWMFYRFMQDVGALPRIPVPTKSVLLSLEETVSSCQWGIYAVSA